MLDGKNRGAWQQISVVLAAIYNTVRDHKKRPKPFTGDDFNPYMAGKKPKPTRTISILEWKAMCEGRGRISRK